MFSHIRYKPRNEKKQQHDCMSHVDLEQPKHQLSLTRAIAVLSLKLPTEHTAKMLIRLSGCPD